MYQRRVLSLLAIICSLLIACKSRTAVLKDEIDITGDQACDIVIVGGGVGGLHTAYRLGALYKSRVCLFEKEARLGGRIYDIPRPMGGDQDGVSDSPLIGVGARRVMIGQDVVFALAKELGITLDKPLTGADLVFARGQYATNKDDFAPLYPGLVYDHQASDIETQLLEQLLRSPDRQKVDQYPDFKSYVIKVVGNDGFQFLHDMSRFRGDFEYAISARGYLYFLAEEINLCCQTFYPIGGMSAFVRALEAKARASGVRFFVGETVISINRVQGVYQLTTGRRNVAANRIILAVPPVGLNHIAGEVTERIKAQPQFQAIVGVSATIVNQWFDKPWWKNLRTKDGRAIWRAYTTGSCINYVEIPPESYAAAQNVIRTVYNDRKECVDFWAQLIKGSKANFEAELHRGLVHMFADTKVTTPVEIPPAVATSYWEWPEAWYFLKAGAKASNADVFDWAVQPLPGEDVGLVGEAYNPQRSGWSDAAYKSSIHLLNSKYGLKLRGL